MIDRRSIRDSNNSNNSSNSKILDYTLYAIPYHTRAYIYIYIYIYIYRERENIIECIVYMYI